MAHPLELFGRIERAVTELGRPQAIWFRGHVAEHHLLPSLLHLSAGAEEEPNSSTSATKGFDLSMRVGVYNNYRPTRLLAWTELLRVALFCALTRESNQPAIFILDALGLNALSGITGIVKLGPPSGDRCHLVGSVRSPTLEHPIAVDVRTDDLQGPAADGIFTLHMRNRLPLEEQCPGCVKKVVLTEPEKLLAKKCVLDSAGLSL